MEAVVQPIYISVEDYLAGELTSEIKHDYIGGVLYDMAGATVEHNLISLNIATAFRNHLRGKPCRTFMADIKIRIQIMGDDVFYYPLSPWMRSLVDFRRSPHPQSFFFHFP